MTFSISINDGPQLDCGHNLISIHQMSQANQAPGQLTLSIVRGLDDPYLFSPVGPDIVTVFKDGAQIWRGPSGRARKVKTNGGEYRHLHVILDGWNVLQNSFFYVWFASLPPTTPPYSAAGWKLLRDFCAAQPDVSKHAQMQYWPASVPQIVYPEWMNRTGAPTNSITKLLSPWIFAVTRFNHSTTPPTLEVTNQGDEVLTLDMQADDVGADIDITPRDDLMPTCVALLSSGNTAGYGAMQPVTYYNGNTAADAVWPVGAAFGGYGSVVVMDPDLPQAQVTAGAARFLYEQLSQRVWEGTFTVLTYNRGVVIKPGMSINITGHGADPEWATMQAVVQSVDLDFLTGKGTVRVGQSGHQTIDGILERTRLLLRMWPENSFQVQWPNGCVLSAVVGQAAGDQGSAGVSSSLDPTLGGAIDLVVQCGSQGWLGDVLADVVFPERPYANGFTVSMTASNAAATALTATATVINGNRIRLTKSNTVLPTAGAMAEWSITVTPS